MALRVAVVFATFMLALRVFVDTIRTISSMVSPLPWFDDWATYDLYFSWFDNSRSLLSSLFAQNNEHRIVFPRIIFFLDEYFFHGQGRLGIISTFFVQIAHATLLSSVLFRYRRRFFGSFFVACIVFSLMFSLRQAENFTTGFQLQFVMVFAAATLSFHILCRAIERDRAGRPIGITLATGLLVASISAFSMANGLLAAIVMSILAALARMRLVVPVICMLWGLVLISIYLLDYQSHAAPDRNVCAWSDIPLFVEYIAAYLGCIVTVRVVPAIAFGGAGLLATAFAAWRALRGKPACPADLVPLGVMMFCGLTAMATAYGRYGYGLDQALESRYSTPSAIFWSAQIVYWWNRSRLTSKHVLIYGAIAISLSVFLIFSTQENQHGSNERIYQQYFYQNDAVNLLALGLNDPQVIDGVAWSNEGVQRLMPLMKEHHLSIFSLPIVEAIGKPVEQLGDIARPETCSGRILSAVPDASLGRDAIRIDGTANGGTRKIRRVLLTDGNRDIIGLASIVGQNGRQAEYRGYAVAPAGTRIGAFAMLDGRTLCALDE